MAAIKGRYPMKQKQTTIFIVVAVLAVVLIVVVFLRPKSSVVVTAEPVVAVAPMASEAKASGGAARAQSAQAPLPEVLTEEEAPAEEPVLEVVEVAPTPVVSAAKLPPTVLKVVVVEEETGMKLQNVDVEVLALADGSTNPFDASEPQDFPRINPDEQRALSPLQAVTNAEGVAVLTMPEEALKPLLGKPMAVSADWGVGPTHQVAVALKMGKENELQITYPGRSEISLHVKREDESPVANFGLTVDVRQYNWNQPGGFFLPQDVKTNSEGNAVFLAYPQNRTPLQFRTEELAMFKGVGRRSSDGNPMFMFGNIEPDKTIELTVKEDVVRAIGTLKNVPPTLRNVTMTASVEGDGVNYITLPITNNQVVFSAPTGKKVKLFILQAEDDGDIRRRFQGPPPSVELKMDVALPEEPGVFNFDIEFSERREVIAAVYLPNGEPAEGVRIRGLGYGESQGANTTNGGQNRNNWQARIGRISGESSIRSQPTDKSGITVIDVPPAASYLFQVDSDTLPDEAKGVDTIEVLWEELDTEKKIVFNLKPSSLLWGTVQDRFGTPVANAEVNLRGPDIPWNDPLFQTRTFEDGTFELNVPPTRLTQTDPNEAPDYYVFSTARNVGGGLGKAVIDNAEEPVRITLNPYKNLRMEVLKGGAPVKSIEFAQLYDVPGFELPIASRNRGSDNDDEGQYRFNFLIEEVSSLNIWEARTDGSNLLTIPIDAEIVNNGRYRVDLANNPITLELVTEDNDSTNTTSGGGQRGGGRPQGNRPGG